MFRPRVRGIALMVWFFTSVIASARGAELKLVSQFGRNLGLFDLSSDGALVLLEEPLPFKRVSCKDVKPCDPYLHRIVVKKTADRSTVADLRVAFEGFHSIALAFLPGGDEVLARGRVPGRQDKAGMFFLWSPRTQALRTVELPAGIADFEFEGMIDQDWGLGRVGQSFAAWNLRTGQTREIDRDADAVFAILGPSESAITSIQIAADDLESLRFWGGVMSRDGRLLAVVASQPDRSFPQDPAVTPYQLFVYDLQEKKRVAQELMFPVEADFHHAVDHVAEQIEIAPSGDAIAISYDALFPSRWFSWVNREARWEVYSLPDGRRLGGAWHPGHTIFSWAGAALHGAASGKLRFSPDGTYLYTTSLDTRRWKIR